MPTALTGLEWQFNPTPLSLPLIVLRRLLFSELPVGSCLGPLGLLTCSGLERVSKTLETPQFLPSLPFDCARTADRTCHTPGRVSLLLRYWFIDSNCSSSSIEFVTKVNFTLQQAELQNHGKRALTSLYMYLANLTLPLFRLCIVRNEGLPAGCMAWSSAYLSLRSLSRSDLLKQCHADAPVQSNACTPHPDCRKPRNCSLVRATLSTAPPTCPVQHHPRHQVL